MLFNNADYVSIKTTPAGCPLQPIGNSSDDIFDRNHYKIWGGVQSLRNNQRVPDEFVSDTNIWHHLQDILPHPLRHRWGQAKPYGDDWQRRRIRYKLWKVVTPDSAPGYLCVIYCHNKRRFPWHPKKDAVHKATISDWEIYGMTKSEVNRFIVRIVGDVWISPFSKGSPTFYAKWKKRICWTIARSSAEGTMQSTCWRSRTKCGRCKSPQTKSRNISRRWRRRSCKRTGRKCLSRITTSWWWPRRPCYCRNSSPRPTRTGRIYKMSPNCGWSGANSTQKQTWRRSSRSRRGKGGGTILWRGARRCRKGEGTYRGTPHPCHRTRFRRLFWQPGVGCGDG